MNLELKGYGTVEIDENEILDFPEGLPGFETMKKFVIIGHEEEYPFEWLQSLDDPNVSFVIVEPKNFYPDYQVKLDESDKALLGTEDANNLVVYAILVLNSDPKKITANLQAPVVINREKKLGKQLVMQNSPYSLKHQILGD